MPIDPLQLLRRLEPPVRPGAAPARSGAPGAPIERRGFDDLLSLVARGSLRSERSVTVAGAAHIDPPLEAGQLARLASAADEAESAGAHRAVMLIDGRGIVMDVPQRVVEDELGASPTRQRFELDAAVYVMAEDEILEPDHPATLPLPQGLRQMPYPLTGFSGDAIPA